MSSTHRTLIYTLHINSHITTGGFEMRLTTIIFIFILSFNLLAGTARVKFKIGEVHVKHGQWAELTMQTELQEKDVIRTLEEARCEIELPDGSVTKILQNSILELRNFPKAADNRINLFAGLGKFYFKIKKVFARKFTVSSPVSVAAIRGTEFLIINEGEETRLLVKSGRVDFSDINMRSTVSVAAGQKSVLKSGALPTTPQALSENEKKALDKIAADEPAPPKPREEIKGPKGKIEGSATGKPLPAPPAKKAATQDKKDETPKPASKSGGPGFHMGASIGAVTIGDKIYNQIGIRPEFSVGKLGVALDLSLYIDNEGNIRKDNWDSARDIIEKIYYVRWGHRGDPFYAKLGAIDNYRLGFGLLMNHYSNAIQYPEIIRTGMELGFQSDKYGVDVMLNNFSELTNGGGLMAGRFSYKVLGDLEIGASIVFDRNQYKGLEDRDGDDVPDYVDDFPDDKHLTVDTDGDGIADELDWDRDNNWFRDNPNVVPDSLIEETLDPSILKKPFRVSKARGKEQYAVAVDASYPILTYDYLKLVTYAQMAKFGYDGGWGITAPGFMAKFAFINAYAEYRIFGKNFLPEYFNTTYELERATFREITTDSTSSIQPVSKRQSLDDINEALKGYVIGADFNLGDFVIFGAEYQNMSKSNLKIRTFRSSLDLNTSYIPKINRAGAYYYQNNATADRLFKKTEGAVLGYRVEYEISGGASLLLDFRQTYRDLDGNGRISGSKEIMKTTNIQTVIRF